MSDNPETQAKFFMKSGQPRQDLPRKSGPKTSESDELPEPIGLFYSRYSLGYNAGEEPSYPYYRKVMSVLSSLKIQLGMVDESVATLQEEIELITSRLQLKEDLLSATNLARHAGDTTSNIPAVYLTRDVSRYESYNLFRSNPYCKSPSTEKNDSSSNFEPPLGPEPSFDMADLDYWYPIDNGSSSESQLPVAAFDDSSSRSWSPIAAFVTPEELQAHADKEDEIYRRKLAWILKDYEKIKIQVEPDSSDSSLEPDLSCRHRRRRRGRQEKKAEVSLPVAPRTVVEPGSPPPRRVLQVPELKPEDYGGYVRPKPAPKLNNEDFPPLPRTWESIQLIDLPRRSPLHRRAPSPDVGNDEEQSKGKNEKCTKCSFSEALKVKD